MGPSWPRSGACLGWCFRFGLPGLVAFEQAFEDGDGGFKVVAEREEQVDVVEVFLAAEAVGEVVAWVDGRRRRAGRTRE